jgi:hypothetical protein
MDEAEKIAQGSNPEAKIVSVNWVYKWLIFLHFIEFSIYVLLCIENPVEWKMYLVHWCSSLSNTCVRYGLVQICFFLALSSD